MNLYISANMYSPENFHEVFDLLEALDDEETGIELFPEFHDPEYEASLIRCMDKLKGRRISFHGPYYHAEHSKDIGTPECAVTDRYFFKTLEYARLLNSKYVVFHHNNCKIKNRDEMERISGQNLNRLNVRAEAAGTALVVENVGVRKDERVLFNEEQFIEMARRIPNGILIDIGHANCNGWDLENVLKSLADKICAYHLHNNDGAEDSHRSIAEGTLDIERFFRLYQKYTPDADLVIEYNKSYRSKPEKIVEDVKLIKALLK